MYNQKKIYLSWKVYNSEVNRISQRNVFTTFGSRIGPLFRSGKYVGNISLKKQWIIFLHILYYYCKCVVLHSSRSNNSTKYLNLSAQRQFLVENCKHPRSAKNDITIRIF